MRNPLRRREGLDFAPILGDYEPPSFPVFITEALDALAQPNFEMSEIAAIVMQDPGASARVLRLVNSAGFGLRRSATSVHQAVTLLGRHQLEATLIPIGARAVLPRPKNPAFDAERFWSESSRRAAMASLVASRVDPTRQSENFTAGLLQDMAIPVLVSRMEGYTDLLDLHHDRSMDLVELETQSYGWHHGDIAAWLGERWGFPDRYIELFATHHQDAVPSTLAPAHIVASIREADDDGDEAVVMAGEALGLDADGMRSMLVEATEAAADAGTALR